MSREIPLLASEKIKLAFWICIALIVLIPAIVGGWKSIYKSIIKDEEGYETYMTAMEEYYGIERISYGEESNRYKYAVDRKFWGSLDPSHQGAFCEMIHTDIAKAQDKYHMTDGVLDVSVHLFVNKLLVAEFEFGRVSVYDTIYS